MFSERRVKTSLSFEKRSHPVSWWDCYAVRSRAWVRWGCCCEVRGTGGPAVRLPLTHMSRQSAGPAEPSAAQTEVVIAAAAGNRKARLLLPQTPRVHSCLWCTAGGVCRAWAQEPRGECRAASASRQLQTRRGICISYCCNFRLCGSRASPQGTFPPGATRRRPFLRLAPRDQQGQNGVPTLEGIIAPGHRERADPRVNRGPRKTYLSRGHCIGCVLAVAFPVSWVSGQVHWPGAQLGWGPRWLSLAPPPELPPDGWSCLVQEHSPRPEDKGLLTSLSSHGGPGAIQRVLHRDGAPGQRPRCL